ncbi:unnamed protein product [marine sediment metagenome]|uniref:Uncharacterized protein n=1 Tax=marine sediment metagenome TaxID=412755 RepID=X0WEV0_9ZZZZ
MEEFESGHPEVYMEYSEYLDSANKDNSSSDSGSREEKESVSEEKVLPYTLEDFENIEADFTYKDLLRYPNDYVGNKIIITAEISRIEENDITSYEVHIFTEKGKSFINDEYIIYDHRDDLNKLKLLDKDIIKIYGELDGLSTFWEGITDEVPSIKMYYVELLGE